MTFQEYIKSCDYDKIEEAFVRMHPDLEKLRMKLRQHYDIMSTIEPVYDPKANSQQCIVSMEDGGEDGKYLSAHPIEGDLWSATAGKEMVISPEVTATKEEIAAQCLWHTSFYGFTHEDVERTFDHFRKGREEMEAIMNDSSLELQKRYGNMLCPPSRVKEHLDDPTVHNADLSMVDFEDMENFFDDEYCKFAEASASADDENRMTIAMGKLSKYFSSRKLSHIALYVLAPENHPLTQPEVDQLMKWSDTRTARYFGICLNPPPASSALSPSINGIKMSSGYSISVKKNNGINHQHMDKVIIIQDTFRIDHPTSDDQLGYIMTETINQVECADLGEFIEINDLPKEGYVRSLRQIIADRKPAWVIAVGESATACLNLHRQHKMLINPKVTFNDLNNVPERARQITWGFFDASPDNEHCYELFQTVYPNAAWYLKTLHLQLADLADLIKTILE